MSAATSKSQAQRLDDLEQSMELMKISIIGITGVLVMAGVVGFIRGRNVARFNHVAANRISLVRPSGKISVPDRIMADMYLNNLGKPIFSIHGGSVLMNTPDRQPLLRIDSDVSPEMVDSFSLGTENNGEQTMQSTQDLANMIGNPAITIFDKDYSTVSILSPQGKVLMSGKVVWNHLDDSSSTSNQQDATQDNSEANMR